MGVHRDRKTGKGSIFNYGALALSMSLSGSVAVAARLMLEKLPLFLASELTLLPAALFMLAWQWWRYGKIAFVSLKQLKHLFWQSFYGIFLFRVFYFFGLLYTSASLASLLLSLTPLAVFFFSVFMLKEQLSWRVLLGVISCVCGIFLSQWQDIELYGSASLWGFVLILVSVFFEALFTIYRKHLQPLKPALANTYVLWISVLLFLPLALFSLRDFPLNSLNFRDWSAVIYTAIFVNIVGFTLWFAAVDRVKAAVAGLFTIFMPLSGVLLAVLVLGEPLTRSLIFSLLLIIFGLLLALLPSASQPTTQR